MATDEALHFQYLRVVLTELAVHVDHLGLPGPINPVIELSDQALADVRKGDLARRDACEKALFSIYSPA